MVSSTNISGLKEPSVPDYINLDLERILHELELSGFAVAEGVLPDGQCQEMADYLDQMKNDESLHKNSICSTPHQITIFNVHLLAPALFLDLIDIPAVMQVLQRVFRDDFILSNFNASLPEHVEGQRIHIDSRVPVRDFENTLQMVAMLCLDPFTELNGATLVWPNSHKSGVDPRAFRGKERPPGAVSCSAPRGSIVFMTGQTWHDIGVTTGADRRWGIIAYYARWWIKPTFDFVAACNEDLYSRLTLRQKELFGFTSRPPADAALRTLSKIPPESLPESLSVTLAAK